MMGETVGFTGTREGMTPAQVAAVARLLEERPPALARHGDCIGADSDFDTLARAAGIPIRIHPPVDHRLRAFCGVAEEQEEPKGYLARDRDIVDGSDWVIATPKQMVEENVGGTWYTVRYARARGVKLVVVWPDGGMQGETAFVRMASG